METIGFVFGSMGFTFAIIAMANASAAAGDIAKLERRLAEARVLNQESAD
jgi:hypothetical protein